MTYKYEGINELSGCIAKSEVPIEEWGYGTEVLIYKKPETKEVEFGSVGGIRFPISDGSILKIEDGKTYDENLNEVS